MVCIVFHQWRTVVLDLPVGFFDTYRVCQESKYNNGGRVEKSRRGVNSQLFSLNMIVLQYWIIWIQCVTWTIYYAHDVHIGRLQRPGRECFHTYFEYHESADWAQWLELQYITLFFVVFLRGDLSSIEQSHLNLLLYYILTHTFLLGPSLCFFLLHLSEPSVRYILKVDTLNKIEGRNIEKATSFFITGHPLQIKVDRSEFLEVQDTFASQEEHEIKR